MGCKRCGYEITTSSVYCPNCERKGLEVIFTGPQSQVLDVYRARAEQAEKATEVNRDMKHHYHEELKKCRAERDELEVWRAKYENENMLLKKEITALKEQNDWYATKYDDHKCLENFLDEVFDNAYECTIDKPWREVFEDYCVFNMNKSKEAE